MNTSDDPGAGWPLAAARTPSTRSAVAIVHLEGELDGSRAATLRLQLSGAEDKGDVLLDLTEVDFIHPVGMGVLLGAIRRVHERGRSVAIVAADPRRGIVRKLRNTGVDRLVVVAASRDEALRQLREPDRGPLATASDPLS